MLLIIFIRIEMRLRKMLKRSNRAYLIKVLTGSLGILGASSLIPLPAFSQSVSSFGTYTTTNDTFIPSNTLTDSNMQQISIPGGSTTSLGFTANQDGTLINFNGTTITPEGIVVTPNGWLSTPKGAIISPNGWVSDLSNRTFTSPDGQVTRLGSL